MNTKKRKFNYSQKWFEIDGKRFYSRSKWERNFARVLDMHKKDLFFKDWEYEPKTFYFEGIKRGITNYRPDFYIIFENSSKNYYAEVKGYMDSKSMTKIKRFNRFFPEETLVVFDSDWFKNAKIKYKDKIVGWE